MAESGARPDLFPQPEPMPEEVARPGGAPGLKWLAAVVLVAGLGLAGWKLLGSHDGWLHDLDEGISVSQSSGKPMFVLYTADWCPPCRALKRGVLKDPAILRSLEQNYVQVKVDLTTRSGPAVETAAQYGVSGIPTAILYDERGEEKTRLVGDGEIASWLERNCAD